MKQSQSQTLITGVYRTGSEYLTQLLNCFSELDASMYRVNVLRFIAHRYDPIDSPTNYHKALCDLNERLYERYQMRVDIEQVIQELEALPKVDYGAFYDVVMRALYLEGKEADHWAEKCQLVWREIPEFLEMMPNGKAILIIRDPRSVVSSFKKYTHAPEPAYLGAIFNCYDAMLCGLEYQKRYSNQQFLMVRYEDIAQKPTDLLQRMQDFLELESAAQLTSPGEWKDAYGDSWHANSSFHANDNKKPFNTSASINRWKSHLTHAEVSLTESICGKLMSLLGYSCSLKQPDWEAGLKLLAQDDKMMNHLQNWLKTGQGIQAFPSDPLDSSTWESSNKGS